MFVGAVAAAFAAGLLAMKLLGLTIATRDGALQLTATLLIVQLFSYVPVLAVAIPLLPAVAARPLSALGLRAPRASDIGAGILGAIGMYLLAEIAAFAQASLTHTKGTEKAVQLFGTTHDPVLTAGLAGIAVFIAPFVEELLFRGFVFNALLRYLPFRYAAVLSAIIFGAAHGDVNAFFPLACAGIVLAAVYYRTGSLAASMLSHATFNAINVALVYALGVGT
jgi:membrane protease YdiL (CAAX protease family)